MFPTESSFPTDQSKKYCLNCETEVTHLYCSNCGQMYETDEVSVKYLIKSWYKKQRHHVDVFLFTTRSLLANPWEVVREYWVGKKKRYYNPFNYMLLVGSVMAFVMIRFGNFDAEVATQVTIDRYNEMGIEMPPDADLSSLNAMNWVQGHYNLVLMLTIPIYALALRFLLRKHKRNYGEILILSCFAMGLYLLLSVSLVPFINYNDPFSSPAMLVSLTLLFSILAYFISKTLSISFFRGFLAAIGMYILTLLLIMVVGMVAGILGAIVGILLKKLA